MKTGIILAGGEARRAGGREKYLFSYKGETFIQRLISTLRESVDEIIIVARDENQCRRFEDIPNITVVTDIRKGTGPVGGLHAGINASRGEILFVVACDMPFVSKEVIKRLFEMADESDAVIPCWNNDMLEPLHAVYKKEALEEYMKSHKSLSMREMIRSIRSCYLNVESLKDIDPRLRTFTNINHLEELEKLENGEFF
ncbi:MAG: molybdenum cofactor guanylyltransferase [Methanomicrobiaceae archaeon]|nr:molybdenum cofactor guanylyltransferase [Methanomicrobiaceae archaeon]